MRRVLHEALRGVEARQTQTAVFPCSSGGKGRVSSVGVGERESSREFEQHEDTSVAELCSVGCSGISIILTSTSCTQHEMEAERAAGVQDDQHVSKCESD